MTKRDEIRMQAQKLTRSLQLKKADGNADREMEEAVCRIMEVFLPKLEIEGGREQVLMTLNQLSSWIIRMPSSLNPSKRWSREEFTAALAGPTEEKGSRFDDYMDAFYEDYMESSDDEIHDFYDKLFQDEQQLNEVDWASVWESVRSSYENWLKAEDEDEWLKGEKK